MSEGKRALFVFVAQRPYSGCKRLFAESFEYFAILVDAPVTEERPPSAHIFAVIEVYVDYYALLFVVRRTVEKLSLRSGHKGRTPELDARRLVAWVRFEADTVHCHDRKAV